MYRIVTTILDWVYPERCELCLRIGRLAICEQCFLEFSLLENPVTTHVSGSSLDITAAVYSFDNRAAQAVKRFKYERATALAHPMSITLRDALDRLPMPEFDTIVPVPIHWSRQYIRGFNQSELLCEAFPKATVDQHMLKRIRNTKPQVGLTKSQRLINLKGAFVASPGVVGKRILLLDDVTTSGGTGIACADALKSLGAEFVALLAFCGEREPLSVRL